jgi:hypothetical protein
MSKCTKKKKKKCAKMGKICNPNTGRCIKIDGKVHQKLKKQKPKTPGGAESNEKSKKKPRKTRKGCTGIPKKKCEKKKGCHWVVGRGGGCKKSEKIRSTKVEQNRADIQRREAALKDQLLAAKIMQRLVRTSRRLTEPLPLRASDSQEHMYAMMECKRFIRTLTPSHIDIVPWEWMIKQIRGPDYLADVPLSFNPTICQDNPGCKRYYAKCWWYNRILSVGDAAVVAAAQNLPEQERKSLLNQMVAGEHLQIESSESTLTAETERHPFSPILEGIQRPHGTCQVVTVAIREGILNIGREAFAWCQRLIAAFFPNSLVIVGQRAFYKCISLLSIDLSKTNLTTIEHTAFFDCSSLASVALPDSLKTIGNYAFQGCSSLVSVTLPNALETIEGSTFRDCSSLTTVTFPSSLKVIESSAFFSAPYSYYKMTSSLASVDLSETNLTTIRGHAFGNCSNLTLVSFPDSLKTISVGAFRSCRRLVSVDLSETSLTTIEHSTFYGCTGLTSVVFPDGLESIGREAFYGCSNLVSMAFPDALLTIRESAFRGCSSLVSVTFPEGLTTIGKYAFSECNSLVSVTLPASLRYGGSGSAFTTRAPSKRTDRDGICSNIESVTYAGNYYVVRNTSQGPISLWKAPDADNIEEDSSSSDSEEDSSSSDSEEGENFLELSNVLRKILGKSYHKLARPRTRYAVTLVGVFLARTSFTRF